MIQRLGARALLGATAVLALSSAAPASAQRIERIIDVYPADEQNQIRRTTNELEAGGSKLTTDIVIKQVTEPIVIEVPAAEDVTDINDLI